MIETHQSGNAGNGRHPTTFEIAQRRAQAGLVGPVGPNDHTGLVGPSDEEDTTGLLGSSGLIPVAS